MGNKTYGGRWTVLRSIGGGGQADAFQVRDLFDGSDHWVLRRVRNRQRLGRLAEEAKALSTIKSDRIPRLEDYNFDEGYLVYRHVDGSTLESVIGKENPVFDDVIDWLRDVAEAVCDAHDAGVVHRDIKPENIIVDRQQPKRRAWLIDFGICQVDEGGAFLTDTGEALGSRSFSAPELDAGSNQVRTGAADVYSLGKVLYWALTGGKHISREHLSPEVIAIIPDPTQVEREYIRRILSWSVVADPFGRMASDSFMKQLEYSARVWRQGVAAVGSKDQLCSVCRSGRLRIKERKFLNLVTGAGALGDLTPGIAVLHCDYCGYVRLHSVKGTQAEELWDPEYLTSRSS